jgi:CheY-like chemotaxis protein
MKQTYTILVVDDEPVNVLLLTKILEKEKRGYKVLTAGSVTEALQIMQAVIPDMVLLDLVMPGINGFEALAEMKRKPLTQAIPVIIITALHDSENKEKALRAGASAYVTKPITQKVILDTVSNIINNSDPGTNYTTTTEFSL